MFTTLQEIRLFDVYSTCKVLPRVEPQTQKWFNFIRFNLQLEESLNLREMLQLCSNEALDSGNDERRSVKKAAFWIRQNVIILE